MSSINRKSRRRILSRVFIFVCQHDTDVGAAGHSAANDKLASHEPIMQHFMAQSRAWAAIWSLSGSRTDQTHRHSRLVGWCGRGNEGGRQDTETPGRFATQGPGTKQSGISSMPHHCWLELPHHTQRGSPPAYMKCPDDS